MFKTKEEYFAIAKRYFDHIRGCESNDEEDPFSCSNIPCSTCMFAEDGCSFRLNKEFFTTLKKLEEWEKEHPLVTYADKYKEVFGVDPFKEQWCPMRLKLVDHEDADCTLTCVECRNKYWNREYKAPKKKPDVDF